MDSPLAKRMGNISNSGVNIQSIYPCQSEPVAPQGTPNDVAEHFVNGLKTLSAKAYPPAGNCFRTTLERATDLLLNGLGLDEKDAKEKSLYSRIKVLRKHCVITQPLYDLADIIRNLGNMGSHGDINFSAEDAVKLKDFTEIFLFHVFTMPARVREVQAASSTKKAVET